MPAARAPRGARLRRESRGCWIVRPAPGRALLALGDDELVAAVAGSDDDAGGAARRLSSRTRPRGGVGGRSRRRMSARGRLSGSASRARRRRRRWSSPAARRACSAFSATSRPSRWWGRAAPRHTGSRWHGRWGAGWPPRGSWSSADLRSASTLPPTGAVSRSRAFRSRCSPAAPTFPYPRSNRRLHGEVARLGLVLSEMPPGQRAFRWSFPARNRLMAGLAGMTVVVEAADPSGSLITAEFAQDLGRIVGAVPGRVTSRMAAGSNALLRDGAALIRSAEDVLDDLLGTGAGRTGQHRRGGPEAHGASPRRRPCARRGRGRGRGRGHRRDGGGHGACCPRRLSRGSRPTG